MDKDSALLSFGPFELDPRSWELRKKGRKIKLQQQPMRLLAHLAERQGEAVTREELKALLWPKDTFVDFETGLSAAVKKLRAALNDSPEKPLYVETIPKVGYRFKASRAPVTVETISSIAVLPFQDIDAGVEPYLREAITEALIRGLSQVARFRKVIARTSVFAFEGRPFDEVGRELKVQAVLTGTLTRRGAEVQISAEVAETQQGRHLWGNRYTCTIDQLITIPDSILAELGSSANKLLSVKKTAPASGSNFEAYRTYLRGRHFWSKRPAAGAVDKALELFNKAVELDPKLAVAYVGIADSYNTLGAWEAGALEPQTAFEFSKSASERALQLDSRNAEAHTSRGYTCLHYDWDGEAAERYFRRALELNDNYSHAHHWYAHLLLAQGRVEEALDHSRRIIELDPHDLIINVHMAWHEYMAQNFQAAFEESRKVLEMEPKFHWGYFFGGLALEALGQNRQAVRELQKAEELSGGSTVMTSALAHAHASAGEAESAYSLLEALIRLGEKRYVSSYEIGLIYAGLGEDDTALHWLEKAVLERSGWIPYIQAEPRLERLRDSGRLQSLRQTVRLKPSRKSKRLLM